MIFYFTLGNGRNRQAAGPPCRKRHTGSAPGLPDTGCLRAFRNDNQKNRNTRLDAFLLVGLYVIIFAGLPIGLGCLLYFVPKKFGHPTAGRHLALLFSLLSLIFIAWNVFEDQLFSKSNAKELVEEQGILLADEFELMENRSVSAPGDSYHTFKLRISDIDKQNAILKIRNSRNFKPNDDLLENLLYQQQDNHAGLRVIRNYETENSCIREHFQPGGRKGHAPTFRRISINKARNELTFEDIDE